LDRRPSATEPGDQLDARPVVDRDEPPRASCGQSSVRSARRSSRRRRTDASAISSTLTSSVGLCVDHASSPIASRCSRMLSVSTELDTEVTRSRLRPAWHAVSATTLRHETPGASGSQGQGLDTMGPVRMSDKRLRVGLVLELPRIDDPYMHGAYLGIERAVQELGIKGRVLTPAPREGFVPSLSFLARQKYDLVFGTGFLMAAALDVCAS